MLARFRVATDPAGCLGRRPARRPRGDARQPGEPVRHCRRHAELALPVPHRSRAPARHPDGRPRSRAAARSRPETTPRASPRHGARGRDCASVHPASARRREAADQRYAAEPPASSRCHAVANQGRPATRAVPKQRREAAGQRCAGEPPASSRCHGAASRGRPAARAMPKQRRETARRCAAARPASDRPRDAVPRSAHRHGRAQHRARSAGQCPTRKSGCPRPGAVTVSDRWRQSAGQDRWCAGPAPALAPRRPAARRPERGCAGRLRQMPRAVNPWSATRRCAPPYRSARTALDLGSRCRPRPEVSQLHVAPRWFGVDRQALRHASGHRSDHR
ncbi:MAG: hypothetical protein QOE51_3516 [Actinoplanes sp.]|jgi:hypothetical protein|nr:hypothetical protein [Actinoplanes sp.]